MKKSRLWIFDESIGMMKDLSERKKPPNFKLFRPELAAGIFHSTKTNYRFNMYCSSCEDESNQFSDPIK